jgi:succinoglycan biosynthesis transport protein ExoP
MLQYSREPTLEVEESGSMHDVPPADPIATILGFIRTILGFIRRQFIIILSVAPLPLSLAIAYVYKTPPLYVAEARIVIDTGRIQVTNQPVFGDSPINTTLVDSQIEVLKSDSFALSVVKDLHLTEDPEFTTPSRLGTLISRIFNPFGTAKTNPEQLEQSVLAAFEKRLAVTRVGMTFVIAVEYQSTNPVRAAQIANAVADAYVQDQSQSKHDTIGKATAWLQERLNELGAQASAAERAVVGYKTKHNIVDTDGRPMNEQQLKELNTSLVRTRADTVEAKARLDRVSQIIADNDVDPGAAELATVADALHNPIVSKLRENYLELAQREALFSARLGRGHQSVVNIRNQMREIRRSMFDEFKRIAEAYKSEYDIAKARENSLQASLAATVAGSQTTDTAQIELRQLESAAQSYRSLYSNFQQRYNDIAQQQSFPMAAAQIIRALPPSSSSAKSPLRILALATIGGLGLGVGLGLLRELKQRGFRTANQVETRLRAECLAMLPLIKADGKQRGRSDRRIGKETHRQLEFIKPNYGPVADIITERSKDGVFVPVSQIGSLDKLASENLKPARILAADMHILRHVIDAPFSPFAEGLRAVKVSADLAGGSKPHKVIGTTSVLPGEGKSTISAAFAQFCAHSGARVILVDCDLRKRSLSHDLAPDATAGIMDVLTDAYILDDVLWSDPVTKLSFLPAVASSRLMHTTEILTSAAMKRLFQRLREAYDYVIVDLSPVAPVVDVRAATHLVDSYLFIVEWGKTNIDMVQSALYASRGVYGNLLGVILNKVDFVRLGTYGYSDYKYGYSDYKYGYGDLQKVT